MNTLHTQPTRLARQFVQAAVAAVALTSVLGAGLAQAASNDAPGTSITKKTERVVTDSWITTKVKSELLANAGTKGFKVSVKTVHGAVALSGELPTQDAVDQVKQIAEKVEGVKSVETASLKVASK